MTEHLNLEKSSPEHGWMKWLCLPLAVLIVLPFAVWLFGYLHRHRAISDEEIPGTYAVVVEPSATSRRHSHYYDGDAQFTLHPGGRIECFGGWLEVRMATSHHKERDLVVETIVHRGAIGGKWEPRQSTRGEWYIALEFDVPGESEDNHSTLWPERGVHGEVVLRPHIDPDIYITPLSCISSPTARK